MQGSSLQKFEFSFTCCLPNSLSVTNKVISFLLRNDLAQAPFASQPAQYRPAGSCQSRPPLVGLPRKGTLQLCRGAGTCHSPGRRFLRNQTPVFSDAFKVFAEGSSERGRVPRAEGSSHHGVSSHLGTHACCTRSWRSVVRNRICK